jgi:hypothetical protein
MGPIARSPRKCVSSQDGSAREDSLAEYPVLSPFPAENSGGILLEVNSNAIYSSVVIVQVRKKHSEQRRCRPR